MTPENYASDVGNCARCGHDHPDVVFRAFRHQPIRVEYNEDGKLVGIEEYTHWAMCPVLKEPILMRFVKVFEEHVFRLTVPGLASLDKDHIAP